ncbi:hypothetical protein OG780_12415 [Streptomyces sp. NBC_00386]|uniref:hypothetical protein n=1 Tax=Streptomyces sp. NBC_00386 TaxID=2975734 RepID=UPI002E1FC325
MLGGDLGTHGVIQMIYLPRPDEVDVAEAYTLVLEALEEIESSSLEDLFEDGAKLQRWIIEYVTAKDDHPSTVPLLPQLAILTSRLTEASVMHGSPHRVLDFTEGFSFAVMGLKDQIDSFAAALRPCREHGYQTYGGICMRPRPCPPK